MSKREIEWVSVEERLPDDGQEVLVCCDVGVVYAQYCGITYIFENPRDIPEGVTHWAELPEGPDA